MEVIKELTDIKLIENDKIYILPKKNDSPIKVITDDTSIECNDDFTFEIIRKLSPFEAEILLKDIFGTTEIGMIYVEE